MSNIILGITVVIAGTVGYYLGATLGVLGIILAVPVGLGIGAVGAQIADAVDY